MAIYAEKFLEAIPHLAKHAEMVREMATSQNSNAWFVYDQRGEWIGRPGVYHGKISILNFISWQPGQGIVTFQAPLSPEIIHFSFMEAASLSRFLSPFLQRVYV